MSPMPDWFRFAIGAALIALGTVMCFERQEKLFIRIGNKSAPSGARPLPRWVAVLMSLSFAVSGVDLIAYRFFERSLTGMTPVRQAFVVAIFFLLAWGVGNFFAGWNARPDLVIESVPGHAGSYRSSAYLGAFVCLLLAFVVAYFAFMVR